ncbi:TolC family outer membrane protein [Oceanibacterium hippocampi]|uniref:Outer membrane efflux protein BepC n=1 Tax=Oceanibacterium hippocampi TaxID=745714 RepID=A0A1Y5TYY8_9PROT|nr:TolC family outer membrane protein [Oceanibacterium hippocampi]SLN77255.1 Outer membrane efflux protein BepC precursor [Oceanibacterium hippocampi]
MRNAIRSVALPGLAIAAMTVFGASAQSETLTDALVLTYQNNPTLAAERANLRATDETVPQALSGWRPTVVVSADAGVRTEGVESSSTFSGRYSEDTRFPRSADLTVSQPLYRGGRTVSATSAAEAQVEAGRARLTSTEQDVLLFGVTAYMNVLRDQAVLQLTRNNESVISKQLDASRDRFDVGEITRTDVVQAEARLSRAVSDRVQAEGNLIASRANYQRIVGQLPGELQPPPPLPPLPASEAEAIEAARVENPTVVFARFSEEASRHDIRTVSGELLPTLSLQAQASHLLDASSSTEQSDSAQLLARLSVPLYQSGSVYSRVRQRRQVNSQRKVQISEAERQVTEGVIQAWQRLQTALAQIEANSEQVKANEIAREGVQQEAQVGSRTTLDVLDAEQELLDSQVALVRAERDRYVAAFEVLSSIGRLTATRLGLPVEGYDPTANYQRVRDKWVGTDGGLE